MNVKLSKKDMSEINQFASLRWQIARASGVVNQRKDIARSDDDVDRLGLLGEYIVAKVFNLKFNPSLSGIDEGYDLWIKDLSIDVKTTFYKTGVLLFKSKESFRADVGILVIPTDDKNIFKVAGFIPQREFKEKSKIFKGSQYCVEQKDLMPIEKLWKCTKQKELINE
jgi:hypothetical protein